MDNYILLNIAGIFILLLWSAFFSGSETSLMSSSRARLHAMDKQGIKGIKRVQKLIANPSLLLGTILLGNNLVNIGASALTTSLFIQLFGSVGVVYATGIMTLLVLIFAEVLPKTIASQNPEKMALKVAIPMQIISVLLKPFTLIVGFVSRSVMQLLRIKQAGESTFTEHDIRGAIGLGLEQGVLEDTEHRMLDSIMDLDHLTVEDVMIHRSNIESINANSSHEDLSNQIAKSPHSRMPVWEKTQDNIIGTIHVRDFHKACQKARRTGEKFHIKDITQPPYFVPETTTIGRQLLEFKRLRRHMALVVDEYGDLEGLVSLEDIIEEIVGDIIDEHDTPTPNVIKNNDGSFSVPGDYPVRDANRELNLNLPEDEDAVTIAGLILETLDRIPEVEDCAKIKNLKLTVKAKNRQAITKVLISVRKP